MEKIIFFKSLLIDWSHGHMDKFFLLYFSAFLALSGRDSTMQNVSI
jgi:hypothetical protein